MLENDFLDGIYDPFGEGTVVTSPIVRSPSPKRSRFSECIKVQNINMSHMLNITDGDEGSSDEESGITTGGNGAGSSTGGVGGDKGTGRRVKGRAKKATKKNQKEPGEKKGTKKNQKEPGELNLNICKSWFVRKWLMSNFSGTLKACPY